MCDLVFDFQHIFLLRGLVGLLGGLVMMSWRFLNASGGFNLERDKRRERKSF